MTHFRLIRSKSQNKDFINLTYLLDKELAEANGIDNAFYCQHNKIENIEHVVLAYENGEAVACGAIKKFDENSTEIKRMFTRSAFRSKGYASIILKELENWAKELSFTNCILETGKKQLAAITLYQQNNYLMIANYRQYIGMPNSICFKKSILD